MSAWRAVLVAVSVLCASPCFCAAEKVIFDTNLGVLFSRYPELPGQLKRLAPTGVDCAEAAKRIPLKVSRKGKETRYETYLPYDVFSLNTISFGIAVSGSICSSTTTTGLAASTVGWRSSRASRPTRMLQSIRG